MKPLLSSLLALFTSVATAQTLTISAASSLTQALREIGRAYEATHPNITLRFNFAASGVLVQQLAQGAPVDIFVSADEDSLQRGIDEKLLERMRAQDFASNQLVLVVGAPRTLPVKTMADLAGPAVRRIAMGKVATVPAGRFAQRVLQDAGLWPALQNKLVQADSVRQVLDYVARGEVDAGFVYRTDAALMPATVQVVQTFSIPVRYSASVVGSSRFTAQAFAFVVHLKSPAAQAVLQRHSFGPP